MDKKLINLVVIKIEKQKFCQHKTPIWIYDVDINKFLFVKKISNILLVTKLVINKLRLLCLAVPKMNAEEILMKLCIYVFFDKKQRITLQSQQYY